VGAVTIKELTALPNWAVTTVGQEHVHGVQTRDMLPIDSEDDNQHHDEEKQYEPDPSLFERNHGGASLFC